ncbi:MAG: sensor domain-containing diguanylate cyclase [Candidatus Omnitrophota bacterium]|jgi:diguanylate cyclase (GGDEF)-like protein
MHGINTGSQVKPGILFSAFLSYPANHTNITILHLSCAFLIVNIIALYCIFAIYRKKKYYIDIDRQRLEERMNILNTENADEERNRVALEEKIRRYSRLREIVEEIDQKLDLEYIGDSMTSIAFSMIAGNKGTCTLYLIDPHTQRLALFKTKKEDRGLIIKTKEGDIFDLWVLRHANPLLVEDIKKDFRFDLEKISSKDMRPISSLISSPLISEHKFIGILRIDNPEPGFYSQDDLRFLAAVCDLGAVALENGELFQRTKDLAIHDELTGLYTKGYFQEQLKERCGRGLRNNTEFSLLMLDIDYFKIYNDKFGHTSGDIVLRNLSRTITDFFKKSDALISRFGGEEFCVIAPSRGKDSAHKIADELRKQIEKTKILLRKEETHIRVSIGVASFPEDTVSAEELILKSDKAMYEAKQKGRNRVCSA